MDPRPPTSRALSLQAAYFISALLSAIIRLKLYLTFAGVAFLAIAVACQLAGHTVKEVAKPVRMVASSPTSSTPLGPSPTLSGPASMSGQDQWQTLLNILSELVRLCALQAVLVFIRSPDQGFSFLDFVCLKWLTFRTTLASGVAAPQPPPPPPPPPSLPLPTYDVLAVRALTLLGIVIQTLVNVSARLGNLLHVLSSPSYSHDLTQALLYAFTIHQCLPAMVCVSLFTTVAVPGWVSILSALAAFFTALSPAVVRSFVSSALESKTGPITLRLSNPAAAQSISLASSNDDGTLVQPGTPSPFSFVGKKKIWFLLAQSPPFRSPFRTPSRPPPRRRSPLSASPLRGDSDEHEDSASDLDVSGPAADGEESPPNVSVPVDVGDEEKQEEKFVTVLEYPVSAPAEEAPPVIDVDDTFSLGDVIQHERTMDDLVDADEVEMQADLAHVSLDRSLTGAEEAATSAAVDDADTFSLGDVIQHGRSMQNLVDVDGDDMLADLAHVLVDSAEEGFPAAAGEGDTDTLSLGDLVSHDCEGEGNEAVVSLDLRADLANISADSDEGDQQFVAEVSYASLHSRQDAGSAACTSANENESSQPASISASYLPLFQNTPLPRSSANTSNACAAWAREVHHSIIADRLDRLSASHSADCVSLFELRCGLQEAGDELDPSRVLELPPSPMRAPSPPPASAPRLNVIQASPEKDESREDIIQVSPCRGMERSTRMTRRRTRGGFPQFLEYAVELSLSSLSSVTSLPSVPSSYINAGTPEPSFEQSLEQQEEEQVEREADQSNSSIGSVNALLQDCEVSLVRSTWPPRDRDFPTEADTSDEWRLTPEMVEFWNKRKAQNPRVEVEVDVDAFSAIGDVAAEEDRCEDFAVGCTAMEEEESQCVDIEEMGTRMKMKLPIPWDHPSAAPKPAEDEDVQENTDMSPYLPVPSPNTSFAAHDISAPHFDDPRSAPQEEVPVERSICPSQSRSQISMFTMSTAEHWEAVCKMYAPRERVAVPESPSPTASSPSSLPPPAPPPSSPPEPTPEPSSPSPPPARHPSPPVQARPASSRRVSAALSRTEEVIARSRAFLERTASSTAKARARRPLSASTPAPSAASSAAPTTQSRPLRPRSRLTTSTAAAAENSDLGPSGLDPTVRASSRLAARRSLTVRTTASSRRR
ncbi:hypothetical protein LshimejAT787_0410350 [Lyophyllum shimeji]|uniref:Uncharacterized protein n=1 Tax=Lyophyllum shimeji TaxID=47721 RepID=A0A9P3PM40_LYOSH|nr:hypothetical protein LshimejAT787_0410350 [Lyophyllum shimeji]